MSTIQQLADYNDLCGESPIWDARGGNVYWTDINGRRFYRCSWPGGKTELVHSGFEVAGFALQEDGGFLVVNSAGFWLWDGVQAPSLIAGQAEGRRCALNDCIADPLGRVFSGSCFYDSTRADYPLGCLFLLDTNGDVHVADEGIGLANGLGFSPDQSTLYFADSDRRVIYAYDYRAGDGRLSGRRVFVRVPDGEGIPDGLTVDADGFVWSAQWFGGCLVRYDPDGCVERRIPIPASQVTCLGFGGPEMTDVFVTSASYADALPLAPAGYRPEAQYNGGKLFHLNLGIPGRQEFRSRIRPAGGEPVVTSGC